MKGPINITLLKKLLITSNLNKYQNYQNYQKYPNKTLRKNPLHTVGALLIGAAIGAK